MRNQRTDRERTLIAAILSKNPAFGTAGSILDRIHRPDATIPEPKKPETPEPEEAAED